MSKITITLERERGNRILIAQKVVNREDAHLLGATLKAMQDALDAEEKIAYTFTESSVPDSFLGTK